MHKGEVVQLRKSERAIRVLSWIASETLAAAAAFLGPPCAQGGASLHPKNSAAL